MNTFDKIPLERHPWQPYLPANARVLMLGSFPPKPERWCMDFFYPNWINDMWRIMGLVFYGDKEHFTLLPARKGFDLDCIEAFLQEKGIALYDMATVVRRLKDNASDKFLDVVEATDWRGLVAAYASMQGCGRYGAESDRPLYRLGDDCRASHGRLHGFRLRRSNGALLPYALVVAGIPRWLCPGRPRSMPRFSGGKVSCRLL